MVDAIYDGSNEAVMVKKLVIVLSGGLQWLEFQVVVVVVGVRTLLLVVVGKMNDS